jgi:5-methylcytosine-specific restriction endonuclease McrA
MIGKQKNFEAHGHACVVCGRQGEGLVTFHHLLVKRTHSHLKHDPRNLIPVTQDCHNQFHSKGTDYMAEKYPAVKKWLINRGWQKCELMGRWVLPQDESTRSEQDQPQRTS